MKTLEIKSQDNTDVMMIVDNLEFISQTTTGTLFMFSGANIQTKIPFAEAKEAVKKAIE